MLQAGLDTGSWAFSSERSPTPTRRCRLAMSYLRKLQADRTPITFGFRVWFRCLAAPTALPNASHFAACPSTPPQRAKYSTQEQK